MTDYNHTSGQAAEVSGEERLKKRKRSFWTFVGLGMIIAAAAGFGSGLIGSYVERGEIPVWVLFSSMFVIAAGLCWFSYRYYMRIDEVDLEDNLWANTFGCYAYIISVMSIMALEQAKIIEPVGHLPILALTIVVSLGVYLIRRMR